LSGDIVFTAAEVGEPDRRRIEAVQSRERRVHCVIDSGALGWI
jgi:hypothetical protein